MIEEHAQEFGGLPVVQWAPGDPLGDPDQSAYRISVEWEAAVPWVDCFAELMRLQGSERITAFLVGAWGEVGTGDPPDAAIEAVVGASTRLGALRGLFVGDIVGEESEISWIHQGDLSPLLSAYPRLEELRARGGPGLALGTLTHTSLRRLVVESGGLDRSVVQQVAHAQLPALEHLELWLGDDAYGANTTAEDLAPILEGRGLPRLQSLALRNCHWADDLARLVAKAKVLDRIRVLDLSLGTLSDEGAEALLESAGVKKLQKLDLHHHYLSEEMMKRLTKVGIFVDLDAVQDAEDTDGDRYVAVSE